ncbi:MAG TPA: HD domain-containing phosphohydrolase [Rhodocyclaceae bacterium]|nr:HD domain-containing phosphohydrolase [Rhodocyclaceae bacterium]
MGAESELFQRLEQLNAIGIALSGERDINRLLELILAAAKRITHADGGTLYRVTEDGRFLRFEIVRTASLRIAMGGTTGVEVPFPPLPLYLDDGTPNEGMVAVHAVLNDQTINIPDAYLMEGFDFSGTRRFDETTGYRSQSFLTVPIRNHESVIIGVLQLINSIDPNTGKVVPFSSADQRLAESLASQAAIALSNRQLMTQLEDLFESFISVINLAIDEKSPYTGGHCQRVPTLTMMIAEAVNRTKSGPFADFEMTDKDRYELKIAGLLHDCGKITTPVHVVDKETKLQTIFDRVHLVDTRFEVLRRDAEITLLKAKLQAQMEGDAAAIAAAEAGYAHTLAEIDADQALVRKSNIGAERMNDEDIQRIRDLASRRTWCEGGKEKPFLSADEVENLTIRAGTLTGAERQIINHHIVATIKMLEQLPWPRHLVNVPEYAGGHHERMDGKGYPKGLTRDQMSVQARIMGIADIFEALTARDRPYKDGMKLSQAMSILGNFRRNGHIDPDLFEIFVREKVYLEYAGKFLDAAQIDAVDEAALLA